MPWTRITSGLIAITIALTAIILGGWFFVLGIAVTMFLAKQEYFRMVNAKGIEPSVKTTIIFSQILLIVAAIAPTYTDVMFCISGTVICFYLLFKPKLATIADISTSILGLFYLGYLPSYWIRLRVGLDVNFDAFQFEILKEIPKFLLTLNDIPYALIVTLLVMACIWAADIGAYFMGKWFGKTKLSHISPKKTVEGAIFGFLGSVIVGELGAWYLGWNYWMMSGLILGLLIGTTSLLGDLT
ncbi:MAG: phosphatidate cytidylyltransferase, partial [Synechococcaceae cyanobacterium RL_1_2]|nr:phosphatidate cytidylyltransferase [Synechococcaceae cyanobacterium RL_1_2]